MTAPSFVAAGHAMHNNRNAGSGCTEDVAVHARKLIEYGALVQQDCNTASVRLLLVW